MSDTQLEERVREAIAWATHKGEPVKLTLVDAKRLLYRLKKENASEHLVYRKDEPQ